MCLDPGKNSLLLVSNTPPGPKNEKVQGKPRKKPKTARIKPNRKSS